jgi:hypothetical protein
MRYYTDENLVDILPGWTLREDGYLYRGRTGYFFDERGYYILQDGRRLSKASVEGEVNPSSLRIGADSAIEGLFNILGQNYSEPISYRVEAFKVFKECGPYMSDVVYQAFQINRGYTLLEQGNVVDRPDNWEQCIAKADTSSLRDRPPSGSLAVQHRDRVFGVLGRDETNIPIVVTRIGNPRARYKLVIAGPHGDERNAQRVIMLTQRYFINEGIDSNLDLALYFIPSISPTLAFADARGLPIVGKDGRKYESDKDPRQSSIETALKEHTEIQYIHDLIREPVGGIILRNQIQSQENPENPGYGIDSNRDYNMALPSSRAFKGFIELLTRNTDRDKLNVFMMHGYTEHGDVYGPYYLNSQDKVRMTNEVKGYVNYIRSTLFNHRNIERTNLHIDENINDPDRQFYFADTLENPGKYRGEWVYHLYTKDKENGILCFDIELPGFIGYNNGSPVYYTDFLYEEGRRGDSERPYIADRVGTYDWTGDAALGARRFRRPFFMGPYTGEIIEGAAAFHEFLKTYFLKRDTYILSCDFKCLIFLNRLIEVYYEIKGIDYYTSISITYGYGHFLPERRKQRQSKF